MKSKLFTLKEATDLIKQGRLLVIAAADNLLAQLPDGKWIGGSIPYLLGEHGAMYSEDQLYVKDFTDVASEFKISTYDESTIANVTTDAFENSIIILVLPANSKVLWEFGVRSPEFENQYINPLMGWISGAKIEDMGTVVPATYVGNKKYEGTGVALHMKLPADKVGRMEIINPYEQGDGDEIKFEHDGFKVKNCFVNGELTDFYSYMQKRDLYMPLVANYSGANINIAAFLDEVNKEVGFYAPVFKDTVYRIAKNVTTDYIKFLTEKIAEEKNSELEYSCSCLYNYFNFQLENKPIRGFVGNFTFGEIGYQLLNVTFVYLVIEDKVG